MILILYGIHLVIMGVSIIPILYGIDMAIMEINILIHLLGMDKQGNFYGYFTVNTYKNNRAEFKLALYLYKFYDEIREDVSKWYELIF